MHNLQGEMGCLLHHKEKPFLIDDRDPTWRFRDNGGAAWTRIDQCHFAEYIAGSHLFYDQVVNDNVGLAV